MARNFTALLVIKVLGLVIRHPLLLNTNKTSLHLPVHHQDELSLSVIRAALLPFPDHLLRVVHPCHQLRYPQDENRHPCQPYYHDELQCFFVDNLCYANSLSACISSVRCSIGTIPQVCSVSTSPPGLLCSSPTIPQSRCTEFPSRAWLPTPRSPHSAASTHCAWYTPTLFSVLHHHLHQRHADL